MAWYLNIQFKYLFLLINYRLLFNSWILNMVVDMTPFGIYVFGYSNYAIVTVNCGLFLVMGLFIDSSSFIALMKTKGKVRYFYFVGWSSDLEIYGNTPSKAMMADYYDYCSFVSFIIFQFIFQQFSKIF